MFDKLFGRKKPRDQAPAASPSASTPGVVLPAAGDTAVYDISRGDDYSDLTEPAKVQAALDSGRVEMVHLIHPMFGGADNMVNMVPAAPGANEVMEQVNQQIAAKIEAGEQVGLEVKMDYDESSHVPKTMTWELTPLGNVVLKNW